MSELVEGFIDLLERSAWNEASFKCCEEESSGEEAWPTSNEDLTPSHNAPAEHQQWQPTVGAHTLDDDIARNFPDNNAQCEDGLSDVNVSSRESSINKEAVCKSVAEIGSIEL